MVNELVQRQAVADLAILAKADLAKTAPALVDTTVGGARAAMIELLPGIGAEYGDSAATIAMDYYAEERALAGVTGTYSPLLPSSPGFPRYRSLALWGTDVGKATNEILDVDDVGRILSRVGGGLQRTIADHHRQTIVDTTLADPNALGWGRVGVGENCEFCNMLISRGEVYRDATVKFRSHDDCNCISAPAFPSTKIFVPGKGLNLPEIAAPGLSPKQANTIAAQADSAAEAVEPPSEAEIRDLLAAAERYRTRSEKQIYGRGGRYNEKNGWSSKTYKAHQNYTEGGHVDMNGLKRNPAETAAQLADIDDADFFLEQAARDNALLEELLSAQATTEPMYVARGVIKYEDHARSGGVVAVRPQQMIDYDTLAPGQTIADPGFTSTTTNLDEALDFASGRGQGIDNGWTIMSKVPAGTRAVHGAGYQNEIIFAPGQKQRVTYVDRARRIIYAEMGG